MKPQLVVCVLLLVGASIAEDSLQGALKAVHRRQRDLSAYSSRYDNYGNWGDLGKTQLEKALYEYLENAQDYVDSDDTFTSSSPFRERAEKTKLSNYAPSVGRSAQRAHRRPQAPSREEDYVEFLNELKMDPQDAYSSSDMIYSTPYKRYNYYNYHGLGYDGVGMRKRRPYTQLPSRSSHSDNADDDEDLDYPGMYPGGVYGVYKARERRVPFYPVTKRFPVTKRSMKEARDVKVKRTDPKVEKELSQLFNDNAAKKDTQGQTKDKVKDVKNGPKEVKTVEKVTLTTKKPLSDKAKADGAVTKEVAASTGIKQEQPLQMAKKSVKWSDYFGIDRRKKSSDLDNEWLIDRYHNAVDLAKTKRSSGKHRGVGGGDKKRQDGRRADSIEVLDEKLKAIEESIIDDTLKFTGATGAQDDIGGEEMKDVKDSIIARLATAYNVEKMRKALKEYRQSLATRHEEEGEPMNEAEEDDEQEQEKEKKAEKDIDKEIEKKKRVAVARKQAVDDDRRVVEEDNNIKCTENDEDCLEQNYKVPREFMEQATFEKGGCERIERACREVSLILGPYGTIFETACNMHQMCMLCSDNSWFSPTRQCNILFLSKADQMCDGDPGCQRGARESIKYLQHVDRAMRSDLSVSCNLECPDKR